MSNVRDFYRSLPAWAIALGPILGVILGGVIIFITWMMGCDAVRHRLLENYPSVVSVTAEPFSLKCLGWRKQGTFDFQARTNTGEIVHGHACYAFFTEPTIHMDR
jgi:hypothetical protein